MHKLINISMCLIVVMVFITGCVCDVIVTPQPIPPGVHTEFTMTKAAPGFLFTFESHYSTGRCYTPANAPYPDYTKRGYGHFILFGDGHYSFAKEPYHEYKVAQNYFVNRYMTPIKDNGNPPHDFCSKALFAA